jgi:hypothetical protein
MVSFIARLVASPAHPGIGYYPSRRAAAEHGGGGDVEKIDKTGLVSAWRQGKKEKLVDGNKRELTALTPHSDSAAITCRAFAAINTASELGDEPVTRDIRAEARVRPRARPRKTGIKDARADSTCWAAPPRNDPTGI